MFLKLFVPFSFMPFIIADLEEISTKIKNQNLNLDLTLQFKTIKSLIQSYRLIWNEWKKYKRTHNKVIIHLTWQWCCYPTPSKV